MLSQTILLVAFAAFSLTIGNPEPPSPTADKIRALDPFIGEWIGATASEIGQKRVTVKAVYKKILNDSCVEYQSEIRLGEDLALSQRAILSWDKDTEMIKAWGFRSNGQRWEASWDPNKEKNAAPGAKVWVSEFTIKAPGEDDQTGTSIKTLKDKDTYTESLIFQGANGQPGPDVPVIEFKRQK